MKSLRNATIFSTIMLIAWLVMSFIDSPRDSSVELTALRTLAIVVITVVCVMGWAITHHIESLKKEIKADKGEIKKETKNLP
ncbi:MAG: hypothetical protein AMJ79_06545 [Phycisphaerae bacterium SM23_30]|nr:MAG: hypothetical protein AMJ79_06545 [Phycisphaerae bacterium SM23_30]